MSLRLGDVDHDAEQLRVEGKGRKTRFVPAGEVALKAVGDYLERAARSWPSRRVGPIAVRVAAGRFVTPKTRRRARAARA